MAAAESGESLEWLNMCVRKVWRVYNRGLEQWMIELLQPVFDGVVREEEVPRILKGLRIVEFTLDHTAPTFSNMRRQSSRNDSDLSAIVDARYSGGARLLLMLEIGEGQWRFKVPVLVSDLDLECQLWLKIRLAPMPPYFGTLSLAFVGPPTIKLQLSPYNRVRLMRMPVVQGILRKLLTEDLPEFMVLPRRLEVNVPPAVTSIAEAAVGRDAIMRAVASAVLQADALEPALLAALPLGPQKPAGGISLPEKFVGELSVMLVEARDLPVWGFPGQSNPYCCLQFGEQTWQTRRDVDTSHPGRYREPVWNQEAEFLVTDPTTEVLDILVKDSRMTGLTEVGRASLSLADLAQGGHVRRWLPVQPTMAGQAAEGRLLVDVTFKVFEEEQPDSGYAVTMQYARKLKILNDPIVDVRSAAAASSRAAVATHAAVGAVAITKAAAARAAARNAKLSMAGSPRSLSGGPTAAGATTLAPGSSGAEAVAGSSSNGRRALPPADGPAELFGMAGTLANTAVLGAAQQQMARPTATPASDSPEVLEEQLQQLAEPLERDHLMAGVVDREEAALDEEVAASTVPVAEGATSSPSQERLLSNGNSAHADGQHANRVLEGARFEEAASGSMSDRASPLSQGRSNGGEGTARREYDRPRVVASAGDLGSLQAGLPGGVSLVDQPSVAFRPLEAPSASLPGTQPGMNGTGRWESSSANFTSQSFLEEQPAGSVSPSARQAAAAAPLTIDTLPLSGATLLAQTAASSLPGAPQSNGRPSQGSRPRAQAASSSPALNAASRAKFPAAAVPPLASAADGPGCSGQVQRGQAFWRPQAWRGSAAAVSTPPFTVGPVNLTWLMGNVTSFSSATSHAFDGITSRFTGFRPPAFGQPAAPPSAADTPPPSTGLRSAGESPSTPLSPPAAARSEDVPWWLKAAGSLPWRGPSRIVEPLPELPGGTDGTPAAPSSAVAQGISGAPGVVGGGKQWWEFWRGSAPGGGQQQAVREAAVEAAPSDSVDPSAQPPPVVASTPAERQWWQFWQGWGTPATRAPEPTNPTSGSSYDQFVEDLYIPDDLPIEEIAREVARLKEATWVAKEGQDPSSDGVAGSAAQNDAWIKLLCFLVAVAAGLLGVVAWRLTQAPP